MKRTLLAVLAIAVLMAVAVPGAYAQTQRVSIGWSNGNAWEDQDFSEDAFGGDASSIPTIKVVVTPARKKLRVMLEWFDEEWGEWVATEAVVRTNRRGLARLKVLPYNCVMEGSTTPIWCSGEFQYRVRILPRGSFKEWFSETVFFGYYPSGTSSDNDGAEE